MNHLLQLTRMLLFSHFWSAMKSGFSVRHERRQTQAANDALVLSGGASQGDFEVGAVRRLSELEFQPGLIVGTSVGSINAVKLVESGTLATPNQPSGLEQIWLGLSSNASMYVPNPAFNLSAIQAQVGNITGDEISALVNTGVATLGTPLLAGLGAMVWLGTLGIDLNRLSQAIQQLQNAQSLYLLDPIKTLLNDPNVLDLNKVASSLIKLLVTTVSLETGDLRFVNQHGVLLNDNAQTPHLEAGAVAQACQGAANNVATALANVQEIMGTRIDYTEASYQRALAGANAALQKAQQALVVCEQQNPNSPQQVVVPVPDAVLASASIPFVFPPVKLGHDNYVDGGVRQLAPIIGAIASGASNVWAVLANHISVPPLPMVDQLTGANVTGYGSADFLQIAERVAEDIMPEQVAQASITPLVAWGSATVTIVQPETGTVPPDIHNGFTVDPGLIRIRMAHGYMRTDDINTARTLRGNGWAAVADQISQLLYTIDIVNLQYQIWLREHDFHGLAPHMTPLGTVQEPQTVTESDPQSVVLADIRRMKQQLQLLVQLRTMGLAQVGSQIVLDRPIQGAVPNQPFPLSAWWLNWEAHQFPTSGTPWDSTTPFTPLPLPGPKPAVTLSSTSLDFGTVGVGNPGPNKTVTVSNSGTAPLTITSVSLSGANPNAYTQTSTCSGATLAAGMSCTASVTFSPSVAGPLPATLTFTDNASNSPQGIALTGVGQPVSTTISFPNLVGQTPQIAGTIATHAGLRMQITQVVPGSSGPDTVVAQTPAALSIVPPNTTIDVTVAHYKGINP